MRVLTWNVLHRVHAENYGEQTIRTQVDERARVAAIVELLVTALENGVDVALLQEVSGDVLTTLRTRVTSHAVINHEYPRVPKFKRPSTSLHDTKEHLVVVAPVGSKVHRAVTYANDPGKGLLAVMVPSGTCVISTHVGWGPKGESQLEVLGAVMRELSTPVLAGGDFNTERDVLVEAFGAEVDVSTLPADSLRTRAVEDGEGQDIDHLLCRGARLSGVEVRVHHGLSDHRPVVGVIS